VLGYWKGGIVMRYFSVNLRQEPTEHGFMPQLQLYLVEDNTQPRPIVIIVPGGGYVTLCIKEDGEKTALQYNAAGFHAAVLSYCVKPHLFPEPLMDLAAAVGLVREHAQEWGINPQMIAVCGFSAGGHLCASLSTLWNNEKVFTTAEIEAELYKPNAAILCFPVTTAKLPHCKDFLTVFVGGDTEKLQLVACDEQVNDKTPPTFMYCTFADRLTPVENVLYYAESLKKYNVQFELHIFPQGDHGAPWCDAVIWSKPASARQYNYLQLSIEWLKELFGLL